MTFVPDQLSVVSFSEQVEICKYARLQAPAKTMGGAWDEANSNISEYMYARSTRCVAVNCEVPVTFCVYLGWEDVIAYEQYLQNNK